MTLLMTIILILLCVAVMITEGKTLAAIAITMIIITCVATVANELRKDLQIAKKRQRIKKAKCLEMILYIRNKDDKLVKR